MERRYLPADLGDLGQRHEVHVFLYRYGEAGPQYLLLQAEPRQERVWRPVVGAIDLDEDVQHAAVRQVFTEVGVAHAFDLISPPWGLISDVGDLQLVQWPVGFQISHPDALLKPSGPIAALNWCGFDRAMHMLDASLFRQNLLQLHLRLSA
jgi:hypothetical protein